MNPDYNPLEAVYLHLKTTYIEKEVNWQHTLLLVVELLIKVILEMV